MMAGIGGGTDGKGDVVSDRPEACLDGRTAVRGCVVLCGAVEDA